MVGLHARGVCVLPVKPGAHRLALTLLFAFAMSWHLSFAYVYVCSRTSNYWLRAANKTQEEAVSR